MAKFTLLFIAVFCIVLVTLVSSEETAEPTTDTKLTVKTFEELFSGLQQQFNDFTNKVLTEERKKVR